MTIVKILCGVEEEAANKIKDRIQGSPIRGLISDALVFPNKEIVSRFGEQGITCFDLKPYWLNPLAQKDSPHES